MPADLAALRHEWRPATVTEFGWLICKLCGGASYSKTGDDALCPSRVRLALVRARDEGIEEAARVYEASIEATAAAAHSSAWALGRPVYTVADTGVAGRMRALKHGGPT